MMSPRSGVCGRRKMNDAQYLLSRSKEAARSEPALDHLDFRCLFGPYNRIIYAAGAFSSTNSSAITSLVGRLLPPIFCVFLYKVERNLWLSILYEDYNYRCNQFTITYLCFCIHSTTFFVHACFSVRLSF